MQPLQEVTSVLSFNGNPIGARFRRDGAGYERDREAGWVAYWPDSAAQWIVEVARVFGEEYVYVRFRIDAAILVWPVNPAVAVLDEGWMRVPGRWESSTTDLAPTVNEVLAALEAVDAGQVCRVRAAVDAVAEDGQAR